MTKLIPAITAAFLTAGSASANDVTVVVRPSANEQNKPMVMIDVAKARQPVWGTALLCKSVQKMGGERVQQLIVGYAQDQFKAIVTNDHDVRTFEKNLVERVALKADEAVQACSRYRF